MTSASNVMGRGRRWLVRAGLITLVGSGSAVAGGLLLAGQREVAAASAPAPTTVGPFRLGSQLRNRANLKLELGLGTKARQRLELSGDLTSTVTDFHDGLVEVACELSNVHIELEQSSGRTGPAAPGELGAGQRELAAELGRRFFVSYRPDGAAVGLWLPPQTTPAAANILSTLAGATQFVRPALGAAGWLASERDLNGDYTAAYRETGPGRFSKQKGRYLETGSARPTAAGAGAGTDSSGAPRMRVVRSKHEFSTDSLGRVLGVETDEELHSDFGMMELPLRLTLNVSLRDARSSLAPELVGTFERERTRFESQPLTQRGADSRAHTVFRDRQLLAGAAFDDLALELRALPLDSGPDKQARSRNKALSTRFEALFRLHPESARQAPALALSVHPERTKIVVDGLSLARTVAAQAALAAIAENVSATPELRQQAVRYLAQQEDPSERAVSALAGLLDESEPKLRQTAVFAYGACARSLQKSAPARARAIADELLERLQRETEPQLDADLVVALGNTGHPSALPALRGLIDSGEARSGARAVEALRFIDDPAVDPLLISVLEKASEQQPKLAAISAIRFRKVGPFTVALADVARTDPIAGVRHAAIDLLGSRLKELPALRAVLEQVRDDDTEAKNRELAARHLGG